MEVKQKQSGIKRRCVTISTGGHKMITVLVNSTPYNTSSPSRSVDYSIEHFINDDSSGDEEGIVCV